MPHTSYQKKVSYLQDGIVLANVLLADGLEPKAPPLFLIILSLIFHQTFILVEHHVGGHARKVPSFNTNKPRASAN